MIISSYYLLPAHDIFIYMMQTLEQMGLIYDWNDKTLVKQILDTSLRDGLQDPSITQPSLTEKLKLVDLMAEVGIDAADIGFPVNSESHKKEVIEIAKHIDKNKYKINICVLARTTTEDIDAAVQVSQEAGVKVEAITIVGSSKVRHLVEKWDFDAIKIWMEKSIRHGIENGLDINFLAEDATRTSPAIIKELYSLALSLGSKRLTIADTVGAIAPTGARRITAFVRDEIVRNRHVSIDWHGHNDRDFGTANSMASIAAGANRVHTTILGIGERAGNAALEPVLLNYNILGMDGNKNLEKLPELSEYASKIFNIPIPNNYPGVGSRVHTTAVGIHAAAIKKAREMGREDLANTVYSGVDARMFGKRTEVFIGPLSGKANVEMVLSELHIEPTQELIDKILKYARDTNSVISNDKVIEIASS